MEVDKRIETRISASEKYVPIIMDALVDTTDDFSPRAQYIYMSHGKIQSISWKNIGNKLNLFNALSVIWGTYTLASLSTASVEAGITLLFLLKDMFELSTLEIQNQDAIVLYYAKKTGAANCWIDESCVFNQIELERKAFSGNAEIKEILFSITQEMVTDSITRLTKIKVLDEIGGKIKICESISPSALKDLPLKQ